MLYPFINFFISVYIDFAYSFFSCVEWLFSSKRQNRSIVGVVKYLLGIIPKHKNIYM